MSKQAPCHRLILIGFMGCGKTTLAKFLSPYLETITMDTLVCQETKSASMQELFVKGGEKLLRQAELRVAKQLLDRTRCLIDTGGGIVIMPETMQALLVPNSQVIFLHTPLSTIQERLQHDTSRPLLSQAKILYAQREPLYKHYANLVIDTNEKSPETISQIIVDTYGL